MREQFGAAQRRGVGRSEPASASLRERMRIGLACLLLLGSFAALAQITSPKPPTPKPSLIGGGGGGDDGGGGTTPSGTTYYEQGNLIRAGEVVQALGTNLMGVKSRLIANVTDKVTTPIDFHCR